VTVGRKFCGDGLLKRRTRGGSWARMVRTKVCRGVMLGRTAKAVSPTRPRVTLVSASASTGSLR
jgi:hypothetical protein